MDQGYGGLAGILGGSCCCILFVIIVAFVIFKMLSRKKSPDDASLTQAPPGAGGSVNTVGRFAQYGNLISRVASDGFYLSNQYLSPGSVVHYRYRQGGNWFTRSVPYQPGPQGHFVHVGDNTSDIQVVDVIPPGGAVIDEDPARTMITANRPLRVEREDNVPPSAPTPMSKTSGYPSAY